jgi:hypothetical protein
MAKCFSKPSSLRPGGINITPALHLSFVFEVSVLFSERDKFLKMEWYEKESLT